MRAALFEDDRYWKSPCNTDSTSEVVVFIAIDNDACGFDFEQDETYLVYASLDNGSMHTSTGTGTVPIQDAQDDLAGLGQGAAPTEKGSWEEQLGTVLMQSAMCYQAAQMS